MPGFESPARPPAADLHSVEAEKARLEARHGTWVKRHADTLFGAGTFLGGMSLAVAAPLIEDGNLTVAVRDMPPLTQALAIGGTIVAVVGMRLGDTFFPNAQGYRMTKRMDDADSK